MAERIAKWESELWSYVSEGDGEQCPLYDRCQTQKECGWCVCDNTEEFKVISRFIDEDELPLSPHMLDKFDFIRCAKAGKIFELVAMLAKMYLKKAAVHCPPTPTDLIPLADDDRSIEVHLLPLKAYHGAIWRLSDK